MRLGDELVAVGASVGELGQEARRKLSSWLAALLQMEHVSLLVGNGLSLAVGHPIGVLPPRMTQRLDAGEHSQLITAHASSSARAAGRGGGNLEDEIRSALALIGGLEVLGDEAGAEAVRTAVDEAMQALIRDVLLFERAVRGKYRDSDPDMLAQATLLQRFLFPFATRAAGRDRLHLFTTNYDRVLEFAGDLLGLRLIDRFVGTIEPTFSASRLDLDMHYSPPGIRGEPRLLEGVVRFAKLHGSVDWRHDARSVVKAPLAFGAEDYDPWFPARPSDTTVIYPNPAKDVETLAYPYAELFRDFAASVCRPNSVLFTFGYGFGDSHLNRVIADMLTLSSTHLVVISRDPLDAIDTFRRSRPLPPSQTTELIGEEVGSLDTFVSLAPSAGSADLFEAQALHAERSLRLRRATAPDVANHAETAGSTDGAGSP